MGQLNSKFRSGKDFLIHYCPGCKKTHRAKVGPGYWTYNGNPDKATFSPSFGCSTTRPTNNPDKTKPQMEEYVYCHYIITDGMIYFCPDSPHHLSGQTVPIPDWPYTPEEYHVPE